MVNLNSSINNFLLGSSFFGDGKREWSCNNHHHNEVIMIEKNSSTNGDNKDHTSLNYNNFNSGEINNNVDHYYKNNSDYHDNDCQVRVMIRVMIVMMKIIFIVSM